MEACGRGTSICNVDNLVRPWAWSRHLQVDQDLIHQSLEQVNNAVKRRTAVVGILPGDVAVVRLDDTVLIEAHDECRWRAAPPVGGP